ncbi:MAG TPA: hypothetical protein VH477_06670 [Bryobacteraceae bacterium]
MQSALLIRLHPRGPWRYGPADGAHDSVDLLYRSDRLFSAVTLALAKLGFLDEWLRATARSAAPAVAFSSLFPFQAETLFAIPPAAVWPPPAAQVTAPNPVFLAKIRWSTVSFVPLPVIDALLTGGSILADQWLPDPESGCLLRRDRPSTSPLRMVMRRSAAVDRLSHVAPAATGIAGVEFEGDAGLWTLVRFADEAAESAWQERIRAAFRLLADTGFGGRRTSGWGQAAEPEFERGSWPALILPKSARLASDSQPVSRYWLLSLYVPAAGDAIDWSGGDYRIVTRAGRVENGVTSGAEKKSLRMIAEGSVLVAAAQPVGLAIDVAPENFEHPVYRSGLALALKLPEPAETEPRGVSADNEIEPCEPPAQTNQPATETGQPAETEPRGLSADNASPEADNEAPESQPPADEHPETDNAI